MKLSETNINDFIIRVRPFQHKDGMWTGEVDITVIATPENDMEEEDYSQVMHFCKMIASTVPLMEKNEEFRQLLHQYVKNNVDSNSGVDSEVELQKKPQPKIVDKKENVIKIDFSKTDGSA